MSSRLYSPDGVVWVSGWVDRLGVDVMVDGVMADTGELGIGSTGFDSELVLEPGEHVIEVIAVDSSGNRATESLRVIVDPDLEEELAYIEDLDPIAHTLVADYVQWLTGDEAVAAAREDGFIAADEDLPGEFYIRNQNPRLRTLTLTDDPVVVLIACYPDVGPCVTLESVDDETWYRLVADPESAAENLGWHWYGSGGLPYWLTIQDGVVVQVEEHYLP